jgi:hypothetical protein
LVWSSALTSCRNKVAVWFWQRHVSCVRVIHSRFSKLGYFLFVVVVSYECFFALGVTPTTNRVSDADITSPPRLLLTPCATTLRYYNNAKHTTPACIHRLLLSIAAHHKHYILGSMHHLSRADLVIPLGDNVGCIQPTGM